MNHRYKTIEGAVKKIRREKRLRERYQRLYVSSNEQLEKAIRVLALVEAERILMAKLASKTL